MDKSGEVSIALITLLSVFGNIYWQFKNKATSNVKQLIDTLMAQNDAKDQIISGLKQESHSYKLQYDNLLIKYKHVEAELKSLRDKCNIPHVDPLA